VLQCVAVFCSVLLSKVQIFEAVDASLKRLQVCVCCGVLQCVAVESADL